MKKTLFSVFLVILSASVLAAPSDVVPKKLKQGATYVRVTKLQNNRVKFEECVRGYEEGSCRQIGNKASYSQKELEKQRTTENWQIGGTVVADIAIVVASAYTGGAVGYAVYSGSMFGAIYGTMGAAVVGGTIGGSAASLVDVLNPVEQTLQAKTLNSEVINDETVQVDDIEKFIERLELVLNKI